MSAIPAGPGPRVTVVIPTYDCAALVGGAIASVEAQTWRNRRIIVVDDGSTDGTADVLAPLEAAGRVSVLRIPNSGPAAARNVAIRATEDDLIACLDADDAFEPDALRVAVAALQAAPAGGWCISDVARVHAGHVEVRSGRPPEGDLLLAVLRENIIQRVILYRRQALLEVGLFDESLRIFEDWDLYIRLLARGRQPVYVPGAHYRYVVRPESLTRDVVTMVETKERVLRKHHRRMADEGVPGLRAIYADQMWWLARMHAGPLRRRGKAVRCLLEGLRYDPDPRRILRAVRTRLGGMT